MKRNKLRIGIGLFTDHSEISCTSSDLPSKRTDDYTERKARTAFTFCTIALRSLAKKYRLSDHMFLEPERNVAIKGMNNLISLVSNTSLG